MRKTILKSFILLIVFIASLYIISAVMNQGNTDMTAEMGQATYPLVAVLMGGKEINCLRGYAESMESNYLRESITPLGEGRQLRFRIDKFENQISNILFEVRSLDGSRLIESTVVTEYEETSEFIDADIHIKDLIQQDREYTLVILLETGEETVIRYYTRIFIADDYHVDEKVEFVYQFHEKTFDKQAAKDLTIYLESNAEGDNTTFNKVDIHSSFEQITWGNMVVTKESAPMLYIKEMTDQTAGFRLKYYVSVEQGSEKHYYAVEEYYRIRYSPERMYLLDFERTMEEIYDGDPQQIANSKIILGITDPRVPIMESDGGNVFAFETENSLYSFNIADQKLIRLFAFYDERNQDERSVYNGHRARILNVDEAGNVVFLVYGYMNRGRHEGSVGVSVFYYDGMVNTVEEMIYIPYSKSQELLISEMEQMMYLNKHDKLFMMMNHEIYEIHLEERTVETIYSGMQEGSYRISESNKMLVWQNKDDVYSSTGLILMNLQDERQTEIRAGSGEYILPLGFMEEDLIYGLARQEDIVKDSLGNVIFPMYTVRIQNEWGELLKEHRQENRFVIGCSIDHNQITLSRVSKEEDGTYKPSDDTQITNKEIPSENSNIIEVAVTETYEAIIQIAIKQEVDEQAVILLTPREVLFEGSREIDIPVKEETENRYYVYGKNGIDGIYLSESMAVNAAYANFGMVINHKGEYVWQRGNLRIRNQIMAIQGRLAAENENTLAVCLDAILEYEGIVRNAEYMLQQGEQVFSILQNNIDHIQVLDLGGCNLNSVLYYIDQDIPVLALLNDGNAVLIIGFNEANIVLMDPITGTVFLKGMNDSAKWLEENGNQFITYIRTDD